MHDGTVWIVPRKGDAHGCVFQLHYVIRRETLACLGVSYEVKFNKFTHKILYKARHVCQRLAVACVSNEHALRQERLKCPFC